MNQPMNSSEAMYMPSRRMATPYTQIGMNTLITWANGPRSTNDAASGRQFFSVKPMVPRLASSMNRPM